MPSLKQIDSDDLKEILRLHCLWLEKKEGGTRADLSYADLRNAKLYRANLKRANLTGADLSDADLIDADLSDVYLSGARLVRACLSNTNLSRAYLNGADLSDAFLGGAILYLAQLNCANLSLAKLTLANLTGANLSSANLDKVDWTGAHVYLMEGITRDELRRITLEVFKDQLAVTAVSMADTFVNSYPGAHQSLRARMKTDSILVHQWLMILRAVVEHKTRLQALTVLPFTHVNTVSNNLGELANCLGKPIHTTITNEKKQREIAFNDLGRAVYDWAKRHNLGAKPE